MSVAADQVKVMQDESRSGGPVEGATILYANTLVFRNASGNLDDDTGSGVNKFEGIAVNRYDNSFGGAGAINGEVFAEGVFQLVGSGFSAGSVGKPVYATDNYTLTLTPSATAVYVGVITEYLSSTKVMVDINTDLGASAHIAAVNTGTINSGDATTDTVITSLKTRVTAILAALEAQGLVKPA